MVILAPFFHTLKDRGKTENMPMVEKAVRCPEKEKLAAEDKTSPETAASIGNHPSANRYYSAAVNG